MTREEARKILGEGASETQVSNMINSFQNATKDYQDKISALENEKQGYKTKITNYENQITESQQYKAELDNIKKANLTEQEKIELQRKEAAKLLNEAKIISNTAKIKNALAGENISDDLINSLVDVDETVSISRATMLKSVIAATKEETEKKVKGEMASLPVEPKLSNVPQNLEKMNLEKFLDLSAEEQEKFTKEHSDEFDSFMN